MRVRVLRLSAVLLLTGGGDWLTPVRAWAQPAAAPRLPVLSTVASIRALSQDEASRGYPVRVRATVTHVDELAHGTLVIHDGEHGQFVFPPADAAAVPSWSQLRRGDLVDVEGRTERGGFAPNIRPSAIHRIAQAPMRPSPASSLELLLNDTPVARVPLPMAAPDASGRIQQVGRLPLDQIAPGLYELRVGVTQGASHVFRSTLLRITD